MQSKNPSYTTQSNAPVQPGCQKCPSPVQIGSATEGENVLTVRNRYFTGKFITARDLDNEQRYSLLHERLHNRLLHGWGIVCGLQVIHHRNKTCTDSVIVTPGVAIDCEGREIILEAETAVRVWTAEDVKAYQAAGIAAQAQGEPYTAAQSGNQPTQSAQAATTQGSSTAVSRTGIPTTKAPQEPGKEQNQQNKHRKRRFGPFLLFVSYAEQPIEQVQALYSETTCDPRQLEANRVREVACLNVIPWDEENQERYAGCWPIPHHRPEINCRKDCDDDPVTAIDPITGQVLPPAPTGCLDPVCDCPLGVPLALIYPDRAKTGARPYVVGDHSINVRGRRDLQTPPQYLTHIVDTNWKHGGAMTIRQLSEKRELRIAFDRQLLHSRRHHSGLGVNQHTFQVQYHREMDAQYPFYILYDDEHPPYFDKDTCEAVFPIDHDLLTGRSTLRGAIIYVTLKCDFILDCHGRPVDGRHIRGRLPSGDGRAGGTFESWFRVVGRDEDCDRYEEEDEEEIEVLEREIWEWIEEEERWLRHEQQERYERHEQEEERNSVRDYERRSRHERNERRHSPEGHADRDEDKERGRERDWEEDDDNREEEAH
jgi:hypothetical protein